MRLRGPTGGADAVLHLRGVVTSLHAGVPGCRVSSRVLAGVDLSLRRGERVVILDAPPDVGTLLLLVAARLLRPDAGEVWCAPGARLLREHAEPASALRGVAERGMRGMRGERGVDVLRWPADAGAAQLSLGRAGHREGPPATRCLVLRRGVLRPVGDASR